MAITTIPWNDGSGDNIYVSAPSQTGSQAVTVTSDANTGAARSKVLTFTSGVGSITRQLTVRQDAGVMEQTITVNPSSYDTANSVMYGFLSGFPASDSYSDTSSNTESHVRFTSGANAETKLYWQFDLSAIPAGATIISVELKAKARLSAVSSPTVAEQYICVCNGTTEVGTHQSVTNTGEIYALDTGSGWTRATIQNLTLLFYTRRGTSNTTRSYYQGFYGADLTVTYTL